MRQPDRAFWNNRPVLVTGHTGFKGAWLVMMLKALGAQVFGLALPAEEGPTAYDILHVAEMLETEALIDIRDTEAVAATIGAMKPSVVLHLAAEALVIRSYRDPLGTFATNIDGTLNVLSAMRGSGAEAIVAVTTDKVYRNDNSGRAFIESDPFGGDDPYSASKAACEIAVASFRASFSDLPPTATARAGNVVGGGDFGEARLIPDLIRSGINGTSVEIRHPDSTRPFQHVLDVLRGYLMLAEDLAAGHAPLAVNLGPEGAVSVHEVLDEAMKHQALPHGWHQPAQPTFHEAKLLMLDPALARKTLKWQPVHHGPAIFRETFSWYRHWRDGSDMIGISTQQLEKVLA